MLNSHLGAPKPQNACTPHILILLGPYPPHLCPYGHYGKTIVFYSVLRNFQNLSLYLLFIFSYFIHPSLLFLIFYFLPFFFHFSSFPSFPFFFSSSFSLSLFFFPFFLLFFSSFPFFPFFPLFFIFLLFFFPFVRTLSWRGA